MSWPDLRHHRGLLDDPDAFDRVLIMHEGKPMLTYWRAVV